MQKRIALIRQGEYFDANRLNEIIQAVNASIIEQPQYEQMMNDIIQLANNYTSKIDAFLLRYGSIIDQMPSLLEILKAIESLQPTEKESSVIDNYIASSINLDFVYNTKEIEGIDAGCFLYNDLDKTVDTSNMVILSGKCIIAQSDKGDKEKHVFINTVNAPKSSLLNTKDYPDPRWLALDVIVGPQGQIGPQGAIGPKGEDGIDGKDGMLVTLMGSIEQTEEESEKEEAEAEKSMLNRLEVLIFGNMIKSNFQNFVPGITATSMEVSQSTDTDYPYILKYKCMEGGVEVEKSVNISKDIIFGYINDDGNFVDGYATKATGYGYVYKSSKDETNIYVFSKDVTEIQSNCGKARWVVLPSIQGPQGPKGDTPHIDIKGHRNPEFPIDVVYNDNHPAFKVNMEDNVNPNQEEWDGYTYIAIKAGDNAYKSYRIQAREIRYIFGLEWTRDENVKAGFTAPIFNTRYNTYKTYDTNLKLKDYVSLDKDSIKLNGLNLAIDGVWVNSKDEDGKNIRTDGPLAQIDLQGLFDENLSDTSTKGVMNKTVKQTIDALSTRINNLNTGINNVSTTKASSSKDGLMSKEDKAKLDGIAAQANKYVLPTAGSALGGIKTGYANNGKNYKVQVDANGNAFVNVPWTDTKYTHPTTAGNKHIPTGGAAGQILGFDSAGTAKWIDNKKSNDVPWLYESFNKNDYSDDTNMDIKLPAYCVNNGGIYINTRDTDTYALFQDVDTEIPKSVSQNNSKIVHKLFDCIIVDSCFGCAYPAIDGYVEHDTLIHIPVVMPVMYIKTNNEYIATGLTKITIADEPVFEAAFFYLEENNKLYIRLAKLKERDIAGIGFIPIE